MTNYRLFLATALTVLLALSGAAIATAQGVTEPAADAATNDATATDAPVRAMPVDFDRQGPDRRHGPQGPGGHGMGPMGMGMGPMGGPGMFGNIISQIDADGDGSITADEIAAWRADLVTGADASADGNLTLDEFETLLAQVMRERIVDAFQHVDADGDGIVTPEEVDALIDGAFGRMDRNGDGVINADDHGPGRRG